MKTGVNRRTKRPRPRAEDRRTSSSVGYCTDRGSNARRRGRTSDLLVNSHTL
ncbi:hypothetical protein Mapa_002697 [Marchantia paleacea]|nr:hypothetical protein Mapa_002697 [Marchantia paleacea]